MSVCVTVWSCRIALAHKSCMSDVSVFRQLNIHVRAEIAPRDQIAMARWQTATPAATAEVTDLTTDRTTGATGTVTGTGSAAAGATRTASGSVSTTMAGMLCARVSGGPEAADTHTWLHGRAACAHPAREA